MHDGNRTISCERMKVCQRQLGNLYKRERFWLTWSNLINDTSPHNTTSGAGLRAYVASKSTSQIIPSRAARSGVLSGKCLNKESRIDSTKQGKPVPTYSKGCSEIGTVAIHKQLDSDQPLHIGQCKGSPGYNSYASGLVPSQPWICPSNLLGLGNGLTRTNVICTPETHQTCLNGQSLRTKTQGCVNVYKQVSPSTASLWNYGSMLPCGSKYDRVPGAEPASSQDTKKVSWCKSGSRQMVTQMCQILKRRKWTVCTVNALQSLNAKLSSPIVNAVLQQEGDANHALKFFYWAKAQPGYHHDVFCYTTMISSLGRARDLAAIGLLLADMQREGCKPTVATYNTLILCYGRTKSFEEALQIFRHMTDINCKPDKFTYSILIYLSVKAGLHHEAMNTYRSMLEAGVQPDTITYSTVINSLGKAGYASAARKLFSEMKEHGCVPNEFTYNSMINLHAKARKAHLAMKYYREMQGAGFQLGEITYTTMMGVLGSTGNFDEAERMFSDMQRSGVKPDTPSYSLMIDMWGKAGCVDKACLWFKKLLRSGEMPSLRIFSSLVNTHIELHLYEGAGEYLECMSKWGILPDLKLYTLLLRHCTDCKKQEHVDAVLWLMGRVDHPAHAFVYNLLTARTHDRNNTRLRVENFFDSLDMEEQGNKQAFANALIEFLHKLDSKTDPGFVWEIALEKNLYPCAIIRGQDLDHWLIDLHSMSVGTALVALPRLLLMVAEKLKVNPTGMVYVVTGWGKRSKVAGSSVMKHAVHDLLHALGSPFTVDRKNGGQFVSYGQTFVDWICKSNVRYLLGLATG